MYENVEINFHSIEEVYWKLHLKAIVNFNKRHELFNTNIQLLLTKERNWHKCNRNPSNVLLIKIIDKFYFFDIVQIKNRGQFHQRFLSVFFCTNV